MSREDRYTGIHAAQPRPLPIAASNGLGSRPAHRDELAGELDSLCGAAPVPKSGWRWVDNAQYKLTQQGQHRGPGPIDLLICATAVHHGLIILHVDYDFATVADVMPEVLQRDMRT